MRQSSYPLGEKINVVERCISRGHGTIKEFANSDACPVSDATLYSWAREIFATGMAYITPEMIVAKRNGKPEIPTVPGVDPGLKERANQLIQQEPNEIATLKRAIKRRDMMILELLDELEER